MDDDHLLLPLATFATLEDAVAWVARWAALRRASSPEDEKLAAVFDVDATLLDAQGRSIAPVCELFDACRGMRLTPFVVTARSEHGRTETAAQLARVVGHYKRLYMHPADRALRSTHEAGMQKRKWRDRVAAHGYRVCVNAGDAWHDHFSPTPRALTRALSREGVHVFVTADGVAHLKLPS